jgi:phosphocarrier protein HPr
MDHEIKKLAKRVNIQNKLGLHARPAALIAAIAKEANSKVWMIRNEEKVDASSIMDILTLACLKGTEVTIRIEDSSDIDVLERIANLFQKGFGE